MEKNPSITQISIKKTWTSGDYVYGAVAARSYPSGLHHTLVNGREYPVARLSPLACDEYSLLNWCKRTEPFPEPIKGFNF